MLNQQSLTFKTCLCCRSVLVLKGNGADVAKHCVPAVPAKRLVSLILYILETSFNITKFNLNVCSFCFLCTFFMTLFMILLFSRISVTFRRMDDSKIPYQFSPEPDLLNLKPLVRSPLPKVGAAHQNQHQQSVINGRANKSDSQETIINSNARVLANNSFVLQTDEFPTLGALKSRKR